MPRTRTRRKSRCTAMKKKMSDNQKKSKAAAKAGS